MATRKIRTFVVDNKDEKRSRTTLTPTESRKSFVWEKSDFENAHAAFTAWADHVRERPSAIDRRKRNLLFASLYNNLPLLGFGVNQYTRSIPSQGIIALNATQNAIDSLISKVCKNEPRPMFTTVGGDYELREKVENADLYIDGRFHELEYYTTIYPGKVLDMCIYGLGVTKIHEVNGEATIERRYPWELIIDDRECMYSRPTKIAERKYMDKQEVFDLYRKPGNGKSEKEWNHDLEEAIDSRAAELDQNDFDRDETSDQIVVFNGYTRPRPNTPGKEIVCIRGKTLVYRDSDDKPRDWGQNVMGPYVLLRPEAQTMGFWGIGMCERVAGIQREINRLIRDIQMAMHLIAKPHWMVEASSMVNTQSLNNDMATIIKYSGAVPPQVYTPQSMSAEVFQHLQYLVKTLYEVMGVNAMSAAQQKPAGLNAAVAIRTYLNTETERFGNLIKNCERSASADALLLAKKTATQKKKPRPMHGRAVVPGQSRITERVTWEKFDLESTTVQVYPTSKLPDTPAGRREYALELAQYTRVTTDDIFEMLEWDDTEAFARRRLAGKRNVERDILRLRRGEKVVRDAIGNHEMAFDMMTDAYEEAQNDGLPEKRLANMRAYIKACYQYMTGKRWNPSGPNPLPGQAPVGAPLDPNAPPPPPGAAQPMLPPGAPPPPPPPVANGGVSLAPPPPV